MIIEENICYWFVEIKSAITIFQHVIVRKFFKILRTLVFFLGQLNALETHKLLKGVNVST